MQQITEKSKLLELIETAGVVGAGGAGFPTHVKLNAGLEFLIINGAECEPLLYKDQVLLQQQTLKLVECLQLLVSVLKVPKAIIGIKKKHETLINRLKQYIKPPIELCLLEDFYPAGDEQVLVFEATGRIIPEGGIPIQVGVAVINIETLYNVSRALEEQPVITKWVTIGGAVSKPCSLQVPLGISVGELLVDFLAVELKGMQVIDGGPMMGKLVTDFNTPVTKTTSALLVLPREHPAAVRKQEDFVKTARRAKAACIQCSYCSDSCPRQLIGHHFRPHLIMRAFGFPLTQGAYFKDAYYCSDCGLCEIVCPNGLSPRAINSFLKTELAKAKIAREQKDNGNLMANPQRNYRRMPSQKVKKWLGLKVYDVPAPFRSLKMVPDRVNLPLRQHIGAAAVPVVKEGDAITTGDLIAGIPKGKLGANLYSSIDGVVSKVDSERIVIERR
ncbi:4Fe-4S dicluster domain-containing protein [Phosphitispora fastidiosa]|uniref:4Fe-4S dicluster domain-containing protein n=1 Tax=Phosphitispora fastidiosa TaxID=2837202 RepID=UPI001E36FBB8|nr:4Fe-4S dicluster domain-containing protein [Phosphitispora fastidiosa]MBU7007114.1 Na+-translocating ferredoxin:NAD+ oxidoreductase RnfC subunit [Phosphitispora fastidiosa]